MNVSTDSVYPKTHPKESMKFEVVFMAALCIWSLSATPVAVKWCRQQAPVDLKLMFHSTGYRTENAIKEHTPTVLSTIKENSVAFLATTPWKRGQGDSKIEDRGSAREWTRRQPDDACYMDNHPMVGVML